MQSTNTNQSTSTNHITYLSETGSLAHVKTHEHVSKRTPQFAQHSTAQHSTAQHSTDRRAESARTTWEHLAPGSDSQRSERRERRRVPTPFRRTTPSSVPQKAPGHGWIRTGARHGDGDCGSVREPRERRRGSKLCTSRDRSNEQSRHTLAAACPARGVQCPRRVADSRQNPVSFAAFLHPVTGLSA